MFWYGFVIGGFLGAIAEFVILSLCVAARRGDDAMERAFRATESTARPPA